jgi:hypothetical protein
MAARTYSLGDVSFIWNNIPVTEYSDSDSVAITFPEDDWLITQGHHGAVVRSKKPNSVVEITLKVMQGSPVNDSLSAARNADQISGLGVGALLIKDLRGSSLLSSAQCWVHKMPDLNLATEAGEVEWQLRAANPQINIGSNLLA